MAAKIAASATANAVQDRFMKTPSSSCPKPKALAFRGEPAFTTVLSKCDAEFAPRVDPPLPKTPGIPRWRAAAAGKKRPRATLHDYHCRSTRSMRDQCGH